MKYTAITENHLFRKAYVKGKKFCGRLVAVYVLPDYAAEKLKNARPDKKYVNRIGISTSKKIGGAVIRSRARRIIREGYREVERELRLRRGRLIVIAARSAVAGAKAPDIAKELRSAFIATGMVMPEKSSD